MIEENKELGFFRTIGSFKQRFWVASVMEIFERWAWYGLFAVLALYLTGSTDEGGLGFSHIQKGQIMGVVTAILYLLPLVMGVIADRIGYKKSLIYSYIMLITGYYLMGEVSSFTMVFLVFLYVAVGAALFKPVISAIITISTDKSNSTLGFGIFYMMVNIGGFIGPAMSSTLRTQYGWKMIFIQAAIVIFINLLIVVFFYKDPPKEEKEKDSLGDAVKQSVANIVEALSDTRLVVLLIIMIGFWTMFNQLFYTLPTFIEDWVDTAALHNSIAQVSPWLASFMSGGGTSVNPEMLINIDAGAIVLFQIIVSYFVLKFRHVSAMITGFIIAAIGIGITFYTGNGLYTILGIVIFAIGEMTTNPTFSSFVALISPKGKEALYMGTYFLPIFLGNLFTTFISGNLYQAWSDKLSLLKMEMAGRSVSIQEVGSILSTDQFTEKVKAIEGLNVEEALTHIPSGVVGDWSPIIEKIKALAKGNENVKDFALSGEFSKNDYFAIASDKLGMTQLEMTQMIWDTYEPNRIWYVIVAIGLVSIVALLLYDILVIRPQDKKQKSLETAV